MKRTPQEETVRQLKLLNAQANPMPTFIRAALFIVAVVVTLGILIQLASLLGH